MTNQIKWSIDQAHNEMAFKVKNLMMAHVKGAFKNLDDSIYTSAKDVGTGEIDLWIDASSISTDDTKRDKQLKGPDFFDVENHKQISFNSSTIGKADIDNNHELWGELALKGVTKNVKLNVQFGGILMDPWGNEKAGFTVIGKINRSYWGLIWDTTGETGGLMVSDEVMISCQVELTNLEKKSLLWN